MRRISVFILTAHLIGIISCIKDNGSDPPIVNNCPPSFDDRNPYTDPIWHPSGSFIGFNHLPLLVKDISQNNEECPIYTYDEEEEGFYLIDEDGTNMRKVLPYTLLSASWSPDGKWIAYSEGAQITIMPFDGENFDESQKEYLTSEGRNFSPVFNHDGTKIAYTQTICDELPCGLWLYDMILAEAMSITQFGRYATWHPDDKDSILFRRRALDNGRSFGDSLWIYSVSEAKEYYLNRVISPNVSNRDFRYSPNGGRIGFISIFDDGTGIQLCTVDALGNNLTCLTGEGSQQFSWSPNNRIVYSFYDREGLDETKGTLWTMNQDGSNKQPLTFNTFTLIQ